MTMSGPKGATRHGGAKNTCSGLCCTKIEHFGVSAGSVRILDDVNLHIHCGELTALIGPNGAGKTTLLRAILGETAHDGSLAFEDAKGVRSGHPVIGYVPQHLLVDRTAPVTVSDLFQSALSRQPVWLRPGSTVKARIGSALERTGAGHLSGRRLGALSGGELQRVMLALALEPVPDLLLLDEPVSGVDQNGMKAFYDTVSKVRAENDLSVILISHDLELLPQVVDRVVLINRTVLAVGRPNQVYASEAFAAIFPAHAAQFAAEEPGRTGRKAVPVQPVRLDARRFCSGRAAGTGREETK